MFNVSFFVPIHSIRSLSWLTELIEKSFTSSNFSIYNKLLLDTLQLGWCCIVYMKEPLFFYARIRLFVILAVSHFDFECGTVVLIL